MPMWRTSRKPPQGKACLRSGKTGLKKSCRATQIWRRFNPSRFDCTLACAHKLPEVCGRLFFLLAALEFAKKFPDHAAGIRAEGIVERMGAVSAAPRMIQALHQHFARQQRVAAAVFANFETTASASRLGGRKF